LADQRFDDVVVRFPARLQAFGVTFRRLDIEKMISPAPQGARGPPLSSTQMRAGSKVTTPAGGRSSVWFEQRRSPTVVAERIGDLEPRLNAIWSLGFAEAGVPPLRVAADGSELSDVDWPIYRNALIDVARCELERPMRGQRSA
jgi:hypothetical protein